MTKALFLSVVAAAGLLLAGLAHAAPSTGAIITEVQAALDKGDAQHAANLAGEALQDEGVTASERGRLLLYRGLAQELLGMPAEAMRDFTQALDTRALPPEEWAQTLLQRGFVRDGLGRLDEAAADYAAVIALKGDGMATALNNRANIYRRQNKLPEARRDYLAALSTGGGKPQYSYYGLGQIAEAQRDAMLARSYYAKAVAAEPSYGLASERLAALGGPPDSVISDPIRVVLHPPRASGTTDTARGFKIATEAAKEPEGTIVLRPPHAKTDAETVIQHPLDAPYSPLQAPSVPKHAARPTRSIIVGGLILRPALDQHGLAMSGHAAVQLGAWRSEAEANAGWAKAKAGAGGPLDGLSPQVVAADLPGKGRYYRLRTSPGAGQSGAALCASLMAKEVDCLPARD
jgi:tetratricopeptide (TPR) repeat protein